MSRMPEDHNIDDVACQVCGSHDRGVKMLICGDENGSEVCCIGIHINCSDPQFGSIPDEN